MMALEAGSVPSFKPSDQDGAWPNDFLDALIRSDWRDWVMAVRKESSGWDDNDTTSRHVGAPLRKVLQLFRLESCILGRGIMGHRSFDNMPWAICPKLENIMVILFQRVFLLMEFAGLCHSPVPVRS